MRVAATAPGLVPAPVPQRNPGDQRQLTADHPQPRPSPHPTEQPACRPDPAQRARIAETRGNLTARIAEAEHQGWLGEVEGLKISLAGAEDKLAQIDRRSHTTVALGIPAVSPTR